MGKWRVKGAREAVRMVCLRGLVRGPRQRRRRAACALDVTYEV
jgi:hypothetical protein